MRSPIGLALMRGVAAAAIGLLLLASCADRPAMPNPAGDSSISLFDPATAITDGWQHMPLRGETEYRLAVFDGRVAIRAIGRQSASGLIRRVEIDPGLCSRLEWSWFVSALQGDADLNRKEYEDVAASVFLLFGDPGFVTSPQPVPTLRYVWTNGKAKIGAVIDNPYLPGVVRSLVVRSGPALGRGWVTERRDILADFERAFGRRPDSPVRAVVLFTDNDQTKERVEAYYGRGRVACSRIPQAEIPTKVD